MSDAPVDHPRRRIRAQSSATDANVMGFVLDAPVQTGRTARFDASSKAPLAAALFAVGAVEKVEVSDATIWVQKDAGGDWTTLKPPIAAAIRSVLDTTNTPLGADLGAVADPDTKLLTDVQDLLERQVNPAVAAHGGHIAVERVAEGTVYLRMSGGCQGCAASAATLREGVERMLRAALPQIGGIVDLTDHEAGSTPFYTREAGQSPVLNRPVPPGVIDWEDGHISIDPDYLAPRLGLTPQTLRDGMRSGDVVGVTETGEGDDAGKTRIVMHSPTRAWAAEIDVSGAAREIPPPRMIAASKTKADELAGRVRTHLEGLAAEDTPVTYGALARVLGFWMPGAVRRITQALEVTMREDAAADRPFIAARTASRASEGLPGKGFFDLATALSRGPAEGENEREFHKNEMRYLADYLLTTEGSETSIKPDVG
ncbi:MAG: DUF6522 family protein [Loktanella sp.]|nr:DUF6522 family protein [Loktanella sp.]